jgi:hypothetical protein
LAFAQLISCNRCPVWQRGFPQVRGSTAAAAASGAAVNTVFMQHFQYTARGHFTVRRLECQYDERLMWVH